MTADHGEPEPATGIWARTTAPQSEFTGRHALTGFVVLLVGLAIVAGIPLLLV